MDYLHIIAIISVLLNVLLVWYVKTVIKNVSIFGIEFLELRGSIKEYQDHLDSVHAMETYYGDATLQQLIDHSKQIVAEISDFNGAFPFPTTMEELEEEQSEEKE